MVLLKKKELFQIIYVLIFFTQNCIYLIDNVMVEAAAGVLHLPPIRTPCLVCKYTIWGWLI